MTTIKGDLLALAKAGRYDVIVHGCNCFCKMGAGIAKQIAEQFPGVSEVDQLSAKGSRAKLGKFSCDYFFKYKLTVVNAYTQYDYHGDNNVDYDAIRKVFELINVEFFGKKIGIPKIGAGLAGGDWKRIEEIIDEVTPDVSIELVEYSG